MSVDTSAIIIDLRLKYEVGRGQDFFDSISRTELFDQQCIRAKRQARAVKFRLWPVGNQTIRRAVESRPDGWRAAKLAELQRLAWSAPSTKDQYGAIAAAHEPIENGRGYVVPIWGGYPSYHDIVWRGYDEPLEFITPPGKPVYLALVLERRRIFL